MVTQRGWTRGGGPLIAAGAMVLAFWATPLTAQQARLGPGLAERIATLGDAETIEATVTFHGDRLGTAQVEAVRALGVAEGVAFRELPIVGVRATRSQLEAIASLAGVRSVWLNEPITYDASEHLRAAGAEALHAARADVTGLFNEEARKLTGVDRVRASDHFRQLNGGQPVSGEGIGILINDSGIDATHRDVEFGRAVVQNVQVPPSVLSADFQPPVFVENVPNTDLNVGHGTFVAGNAAGRGVQSGGRYEGVAPGAHLIGVGSGAGLFILNALAGYDYMLSHQFEYDIRVMNNSWSNDGAFDPDSPVAVANKIAHDRGIVVVFAAANDGPAENTLNPHAEDPNTIGVAAGNDLGLLTGFSSRGIPGHDRRVPDITAPGEAMISLRASTGFVHTALDAQDDAERLTAAELPFYTIASGTSFASPHVAGIVALMLEANPLLSPDEVKQILKETATNMPAYEAFEVGAGYANAFAAVQKAFDTRTPFAATVLLFRDDFNTDDACTLSDVPGHASEIAIINAVEARALDGFADGTFRPDAALLRSELARSLLFALETRQFLPVDGSITFADVGTDLRPFAEAVVAQGAAMRDLEHDDGPVLHTEGGQFLPADAATRAHVAYSLVQSLGLEDDAAARAAGTGSVATLTFTETFTGLVPIGAAGATLVEGVDYVDVPFTAKPSASQVTAVLTADVGVEGVAPDLDFVLLDADGHELDNSGNVGATEQVSSPIEGGGTYVYRVVGFANAATTFTIVSEQTVSDPADANGTETVNLVDFDEVPAFARGHVLLAVDLGLMPAFPAELVEVAPGQFQAIPGPRFEPNRAETRAEFAEAYGRWRAIFFGGAVGLTMVDAEGDHLGTGAQDILSANFEYDPAADQIVYTLQLADLSLAKPNDRWTMESGFGQTTVFVSASITETTAPRFTWGTIAPDPDTGVNTQTNRGTPDAATLDADNNRIVIRLNTASINPVVGFDIVGTTSTAPTASSWATIGTSVTGGLLLRTDDASGSDFKIGEGCAFSASS